MFQGALKNVEPEADSDKVLMMVVLRRGEKVHVTGNGIQLEGGLTSSVCTSHGGGEDLSCDRIASKAALLYR